MNTKTMHAVYLTGHGGFEKLEYREDIPVPTPSANEVLINIKASGVNNTDINTRTAWYSKAVTSATSDGGSEGFDVADQEDSSWSGSAIQFPRIQGADCCGIIVAVGEGVNENRIGERVLVSAMHDDFDNPEAFKCFTFGSEMDGGFAQYTTVHSKAVHTITSDWSDAQLASIPCAYSTAENMLHRTKLGAERVLITGASGGVGSAAVQLAKRRGAEVIALSSPEKFDQVKALGADIVLARDADLVEALDADSIDLVVDLVAGPEWPKLLDVLKRGGRYATAGAIAGPMVELDVRTLYLKDFTFYGCTYQDPEVFKNLVGYIERNEIRPAVAATYPLKEIAQAQKDFLAKQFTGKLVLIPPAVGCTVAIKGVLFDKDGTLFKYGNTWQIWCERVIHAMAPVDKALQKALADGCGFNIETKVFAPGSLVVNASAHEINLAWEAIHPELSYQEIEALGVDKLQNLPVVPVCDLNKMLTSLKTMGIQLGCATNDFESSAKMQLSEAGVYEQFDFVCGFDSGHGAKPSPGMLNAFAKHCGIHPSEVVMVGDSTHDLNCGEAAGSALCVGVLTGPAAVEDIQDFADVVLGSVELLPEYLKRTLATNTC